MPVDQASYRVKEAISARQTESSPQVYTSTSSGQIGVCTYYQGNEAFAMRS